MTTNTKYPILTDKQPSLSSPGHCKLEKLFLVARHGTRYPEEPDINKFEVLEKIFQNVSSKPKWKNQFSLLQDSLLSTHGQKEHYLLGKRAFKKYHKFWKTILPYDPYTIKFRSSETPRTGMSGISYSIGLFDEKGILGKGDYQPVYLYTIPVLQDYELAIHRSCPRWQLTVQKNNKELEKQISLFTSNLTKISNRISKKYNIDNQLLEPIHANYIYLACAYDIIFFNKHKHWCELLQQEEILILEYFNDMKYYYEFAYGNDLNKRLACKLVSEIVKSVDDYLNGDSIVKADLKFTHSETIMFLYTFLGLYEDSKPLTGDANFDEISNRKFKTSEICPFSANIYFEIYTCTSDKYTFFAKKKHEESTVVQVVVNEKPVVIPGCDSKFCEWSKFKELFSDNLGCDFENICNIDMN
ncbi:2304_t:CDS:2 [Funneliformis geosporum]|uniref:Multiple inositol polyphosphate phosphatase 1 n=1 Tax=Funneliformis geosporum TaxID=1117311 RepID=A0A9W4T150_9GLOM|nr:14217_t:CDS:2 [Funneliformis geosporum]CAI2188989.1 2304_t:CDS:2 [Funneliformis geosporum]